MERGVPMPDNAVSLNPKAREHLRGALLRGDRAAAAAMLAGGCAEALRHEKNAVLQALTARVKLYELTCNMEPDAARVAFEGMGGMLT